MGANAHFDERAEESSSGLSFVEVSLSKTSTTARSSQVATIRAQMTLAEIKAKQLALEEQRRMGELEKQLEVKRKLELVQDEAERLKFKAGDRRKTQKAKDEAACARLAAEAAIFEKVQSEDFDPEALLNRLLDFADESLEFEESAAVVGHLPIIPKPLTGISHEAEVNRGNVLSNNVTAEVVKSSSSFQQPKPAVSFEVPERPRSDKTKETMPSYHSWIGYLQEQPSALTSTNNQKPLFCGHSAHDSLPKLRLDMFDGNRLHWSDWSSMFKSIVHDANVYLNGKMQHLQNTVTERAKFAIEGYGYGGDSYYEALKELESRFGKPSFVVKVTLDRLRKTARVQNDKPQEVRTLSDAVSTTVWTLKKFGYESDLKADSNISPAVEKLSQELTIKWKDNTKATNLERPSLVDFSLWLNGEADIYDDCYPKVSGKFSSQPPKNKTRFGGSSGRQSF